MNICIMLSQPPVGVLPGTLCTSIEEPLPSKWASRALKYLHSGFKPWTRLPQVLIMEEIETFPGLLLVTRTRAGQWTAVQGHVSCQAARVPVLYLLYLLYMITHSCSHTSPFVIYFHKDIPN